MRLITMTITLIIFLGGLGAGIWMGQYKGQADTYAKMMESMTHSVASNAKPLPPYGG